MSVFIVIHGLLLNLMSVDSVVTIKPPVINELGDLFTEDFQHVNPVVMTTMYYYPILMNPKNQHKFGALRERIKPDGLFDFGVSPIELLAQRLKNAATKSKEVVFISVFFLSQLRPFFCFGGHEALRNNLHLSESVHSGILSTFYNENIDPRLRALINYRIRNYLEFAQARVNMEVFSSAILSDLPQDDPIEIMKCIRYVTEVHLDEPPGSTPLTAFYKTLKWFISGIIASMCC